MNETELLKQYSELAAKKAQLKTDLVAVEATMKELQEPVMSWFQEAGVQRINIGNRTLYLRRELWAGRVDGVSNEMACEVLKLAGLEEFAVPKVNTQKLSAWCRELDAAGESLPAGFDGVIKVSETFKIGSTAGR